MGSETCGHVSSHAQYRCFSGGSESDHPTVWSSLGVCRRATPRRTISEATRNVAHTVSRARPLARRRASTFRPPLVLIRFLNPCSLFLFKFDGSLKVVDMATLLHTNPAHKALHYMSRPSVCQSRDGSLVDLAAGLGETSDRFSPDWHDRCETISSSRSSIRTA